MGPQGTSCPSDPGTLGSYGAAGEPLFPLGHRGLQGPDGLHGTGGHQGPSLPWVTSSPVTPRKPGCPQWPVSPTYTRSPGIVEEEDKDYIYAPAASTVMQMKTRPVPFAAEELAASPSDPQCSEISLAKTSIFWSLAIFLRASSTFIGVLSLRMLRKRT